MSDFPRRPDTRDPEPSSDPAIRRTFESIHDPGERSAAYCYSQALGPRLLAAMLPLMVGAAVAMLLGRDPVVVVLWTSPVAVGAAVGWAALYLSSTPARIDLWGDRIAVRSIWDVAANHSVSFEPFLGAERTAEGLRVSAGWTVHTLRPRHWPRFDQLQRALSQNQSSS